MTPPSWTDVRAADNARLAREGAPYRYDYAGLPVCARCRRDWTEGHRCEVVPNDPEEGSDG